MTHTAARRGGGLPRAALALALGLLGACNLRPLYLADPADDDLRPELAAVEVETPPSRVGQIVKRSLARELDPTSAMAEPRYRYVVGLREATDRLGILPNATVTRYNLTLYATAQLLSVPDNRVVHRTQVNRVASYNLVPNPYAAVVGSQDAERRVALDIAKDLRTQLALYFRREAEDATAPGEAPPVAAVPAPGGPAPEDPTTDTLDPDAEPDRAIDPTDPRP